MQSPLTPQRGRIESNPREYTHMGPWLCGELKTMLADWAKAPRASHSAISRAAHRNLRQSSYNSPMRIAHDDDIGARD